MLAKATSYEVDISFKRVKDKEIKEVVFASYYSDISKSELNTRQTSNRYPAT